MSDVTSGSSRYMPCVSAHGALKIRHYRIDGEPPRQPREHPRTRATAPRLRHGLAQFDQFARPVLGVAPLDRCQLVQYFLSLAVRGFREAVIQVGTVNRL